MIKGKKVSIRAIEESDMALLLKWNFDPVITEFFSPRLPTSMFEQKKWFESQFSASKKKLIISSILDQKPIGMIGIMDIDHVNKNCEIGITIGEIEAQGKGFAKEAMCLTLNFIFHQFNMNMVFLKVFESNTRAIQFFEKIGFKKDGVLRNNVFKNGNYISTVYMSMLKTEFKCNP